MEIYSMPSLASKFHLRQKTTVALILAKGVSTYGMTALEVTDIVGYQTAWTPKYEASVAKMTKIHKLPKIVMKNKRCIRLHWHWFTTII